MNGVEPKVSVLFITFNRFALLEKTVESFRRHTEYSNLELVIADDGSPKWMQDKIEGLGVDKIVLARRNRGLGANTNAGLAACSGKYILSLQDDWECQGPASYLRDAVSVLELNPSVGYVPFYGLDRRQQERDQIKGPATCYLLDEGNGPPIYTDTPHLKSQTFVRLMGKYLESRRMERTELDFCRRFSRQKAFASAYFPSYYNFTFKHIGEAESWRGKDWESRVLSYCAGLFDKHPRLLQVCKVAYRRRSL